MNLAKKTLHGGLWNLMSNIGQQAVNFLFFVFMARLLEPSAFGLMALALVIIDVFGLLGRIGLVEACVQRTDLSDDTQNRVFWLLQSIGLLLAFFVFLAADPLSIAFGHADLAVVFIWLAPVCWLQNLSAVPEARLQKAFGFDTLAKRCLWGVFIGGIVGAGMAYAGFGVYSLVGQKISCVLIQNIILWSAETWRPKVPTFNITDDMKKLLRTGWHVTVSELMLTLNTKLMDVLVGLFLGPATLGYLRTAWKCFEVSLYCAIYPFVGVALVAFSELKSDAQRLSMAYRRLTEISSLILFPVLLGLSAVAPIIVPLFFGPQWGPSIILLQVLGFMAAAGAIGPFFSPIITATGHTEYLVKQGALQTILSLLLTASAAPFGAVAVVFGQVFRSILISAYNLWVMWKKIQIPFSITWKATMPALVAASIMWVVVVMGQYLLPESATSDWVRFILMILLGAVTYAGVLMIGFYKDMKDLIKEGLRLIKDKGQAAI